MSSENTERTDQPRGGEIGVQRLAVQHAGVGGGEGAEPRGGGRDGGGVHVQAGVLLLPLGAPVLEPDLHLEIEVNISHMRVLDDDEGLV